MPMQPDRKPRPAEGPTVIVRRWLGLKQGPDRQILDLLYAQIVAAARREVFFSQWQAPDTPLGRFEMVALHVFLFQHRLRGSSGAARDVAQQLIDDFFTDIEHSLRELGVGDVGVPKRMKKLARMFYGRTLSYARAIEENDEAALAVALARNVRPQVESWPQSRLLASYVMAADAALAAQSLDDIVGGAVSFPAPVADVESRP